MLRGLTIRAFNQTDPRTMEQAFRNIGWNKPASLFERYLADQASHTRACLVATLNQAFAGYITVCWKPDYSGFAERGIPEIQDLNVLPDFRRRGIATALLNDAEAQIARVSGVAGIGVGLHPGYNNAQKLYGKRGYVPDGLGVTYRNRFVREGEHVILDDNLVLHLVRHLHQKEPAPRAHFSASIPD
jgi:GNAT superfamily N-acetyltransferase